MYYIGAHVSSAKGVHNIFKNTEAIGGNATAFFVRSQRKWTSNPLQAKEIEAFSSLLNNEFSYLKSKIVVHGSYLTNLANPDLEVRNRSIDAMLDEVTRCDQLGVDLYAFHPGSTLGKISVSEGAGFIADALNIVIEKTKSTRILIETMAGQGSVVGKTFEEISQIIDRVNNKNRIGVCLDTCHIFAAGYDIRTKGGWDRVLKNLEAKVGLHYLQAIHLNDSKCDFDSKKDRHESIGKGKIGIESFKAMMNDPRFENIPLILETPADDEREYKAEIEMLRSFSNSHL